MKASVIIIFAVALAVANAGVVPLTAPVVAAHGLPGLVSAYSAPVIAAPGVYGAGFVAAHGLYAPGVVAARTLVASPLTASGYPLLAPGSGLEGQYVPDNTEQLYDDGSYKGEA